VASITIRDLDEETKERLRRRAARRSRSMEDEVRHILREAVAGDEQPVIDLVGSIRALMERAGGGVELALPARGPTRTPPSFD